MNSNAKWTRQSVHTSFQLLSICQSIYWCNGACRKYYLVPISRTDSILPSCKVMNHRADMLRSSVVQFPHQHFFCLHPQIIAKVHFRKMSVYSLKLMTNLLYKDQKSKPFEHTLLLLKVCNHGLASSTCGWLNISLSHPHCASGKGILIFICLAGIITTSSFKACCVYFARALATPPFPV